MVRLVDDILRHHIEVIMYIVFKLFTLDRQFKRVMLAPQRDTLINGHVSLRTHEKIHMS